MTLMLTTSMNTLLNVVSNLNLNLVRISNHQMQLTFV